MRRILIVGGGEPRQLHDDIIVVLALPTWERTVRVLLVWVSAVVFGRDIVALPTLQQPRAAFIDAAVPRAAAARGSDPTHAR